MQRKAHEPEPELYEMPAPKPIEISMQRRESVVIGRDLSCDIVIKDAKASRKHCRLSRNTAGFLVEDLSSRNGTFVDGVRIQVPTLLKVNQTFKVGDTVFYLSGA